MCIDENSVPAARAAFKSRAAEIFAAAGKSSLPKNNTVMFLNTICQKGIFGVALSVAYAAIRPAHLQQFDIGLDIGSKGHFDNMINPVRSERSRARLKFLIVAKHFVGASSPCCFFF